MFAIVDAYKIPARCFGEPLCVAAVDRHGERAYMALCEALYRNRQVGIATVDLDGEPRLAALVPIGGVLAVSPLEPQYTDALASGLRRGRTKRRPLKDDCGLRDRPPAA